MSETDSITTNGVLSPVLEFARRFEADQIPSWQRLPGARVDMHCHSTFSDERLRWLPGVVYHPMSTPEQVYDQAKARGMDFVTITDHDTIDGCLHLLNRRGDLADFFIGEEVSVTFPEDGTVVHINVFDHNEQQHREIQPLRRNIYECVEYLRRIDKLYVINHLTWTAQHRVLKPWQIEAMLRLFPVFEGLNGTRSYAHNAFAWYATRGHDKVMIGGSDSHTNRVGTTYTLSQGDTPTQLIANIRSGQAAMCGAFGTPEKLADDVWLCLQAEAERRLADASSMWERAVCRAARRLAWWGHRLACLGYNVRQDTLIRGFARALPA